MKPVIHKDINNIINNGCPLCGYAIKISNYNGYAFSCPGVGCTLFLSRNHVSSENNIDVICFNIEIDHDKFARRPMPLGMGGIATSFCKNVFNI